MKKSATDVMQEIVFSAAMDALAALKTASKGLPNTLLRDINAIHANTTFADLPPELQSAIAASVRTAFTRLLREGYNVAPAGSAPPPRPQRPPPREGSGGGDRPRGRPQPRPGDGRKPPRPGGGRPGRKPPPR